MVLHRKPPHFKLHLYCDNKSLVKRVNNFLNFFDGSFRRALTPNYDVVYLIACVLRCLPEHTVTLTHVKGHQDTQQPTNQLSWPAQLNVIADRLADGFTATLDTPAITPFLPTAQIHLRDRFHTPIIKRWSQCLRSTFFRSDYEQWLCRQFKWDHRTLLDIDFDGLDTALRIQSTHMQRFVIKWSNQSLPVRRRVHRYDRLIPPTCKSCPTITECDSHLLRCSSAHRRSACFDAYTSIHDHLIRLHTAPTIHQTILHILAHEFDIPTCSPNPTTNPVLSAQSAIGHQAFLKGRWSRAFRTEQECFYRHQLRPPTYSGDRWMKLTLSSLFEQLHNIWKCRNLQTHGADQAIQDRIRREHLTLRVTALYNQISNLLVHDRAAFDHITQEDILSGPISAIETWLRMAEPTVQQCLTDAQLKLLSHQRDIRDYFDEAPYIDSDASDTSLSYDTFDDPSSISFPSQSTRSSLLSSSDSSLSSISDDTPYSDTDSS